MNNKQVYILIGPKGSGKTFIGTLFKNYFTIDFIRVEDWILKVRNGRDIEDDDYIRDVFSTVEKGVKKALRETDNIVFESTGLSKHFDQLIDNLRSDFNVITIKINADLGICLNRIQTRDKSIHISVSDDQVEKVNKLVIAKNMRTDYAIDNNNKSADDLIFEIKAILKNTIPQHRI
ncbi:MAG: hypothetical protein JW973_11655 [Bacteroidales bacterium]|nr:hypothetical protein [Bacteroidales bacterium]